MFAPRLDRLPGPQRMLWPRLGEIPGDFVLNTVFQRSESKDYLDIHALIGAGLSLADGLGCARAVYGPGFNPMLPLKALTYFLDGDLPTLPDRVQRDLVEAVQGVSSIPSVTPRADRICPGHG